MALDIASKYPGKSNAATAAYPFGSARNITTPGDGTGTPLEEAWLNDLFGFQQALINGAGLTPSGNADTAQASQYLEAARIMLGAVAKSVAELEAITASVEGQRAFLSAGGRYGPFNATLTDISTQVTADPLQGVYVAFASDPTGASGGWVRELRGFVTFEMFGGVPDFDRSTTSGTDNKLPVQSAINLVYDVLRVEIRVTGDFGHSGIIVIPDSMTLRGIGRATSGLFRTDTDNVRGVLVGTYGPGNGPDTPAAGTYYSITAPSQTEKYVTTTTAADAGNFAAGDIVGVEGPTALYGTFRLPNMVTEVLSADPGTGVVMLLDELDDDYTGGRIVKLNDGTASSNAVDSTGRTWPLLVALGTCVSDMAIHGHTSTGWAAVNLSTYKTEFYSVDFYARNCLAGNPVAKTDFVNCSGSYTNAAYEFAYYSHDTTIDASKFKRVGDAGGTNVVAGWCNTGEGGKRIHFVNGSELDDRGSADSSGNSVLTGPGGSVHSSAVLSDKSPIFGNKGATLKNSRIYRGGGTSGVSGFDGGVIDDNTIVSGPSVVSGESVRITAGRSVKSIKGNTLASYDGTKRDVDIIYLDDVQGSEVGYNDTFSSVRPVSLSFQTTLTESGNQVTPVSLVMTAGSMFAKDEVELNAVVTGTAGEAINIFVNSTSIASLTFAATGTAVVRGSVQYDGPGSTRAVYTLTLDEAGAVQTVAGENYSVDVSTVTNVDLRITGMAAAATSVRRSASARKISNRVF